MKKKIVSIVLTALMVASLTTACGGKDNTQTTTPASNTKTETTASTTTTDTSTPAAETKTTPESQAAPADDSASASEDFTLLDVSTDMIETGVYAVSEDGTELVFSMFTEPSGTPMASLFVFPAAGEGDVICGTFTADSETDEDGIAWTALTVTDAYTDGEFVIGFGELGDEVYILDQQGTAYEGQYLTADDTIEYMGTAAALLEGGAGTSDGNADASSGDFTLLDVSSDMIKTGVYAVSEDGTELVFSMFTEPSGTPMASLFVFTSDGSGDVICGTFTADSETDEDGIAWTALTVADAYTDGEFVIGFGELGDEVYILDQQGNAYEGKYLTADDTITYMGTAAALLQ